MDRTPRNGSLTSRTGTLSPVHELRAAGAANQSIMMLRSPAFTIVDTIGIGGRDFARTRKFHNAQHNPNVALVADDVLPPWRPRCVLIRGRAEALAAATDRTASRPGLSSGCIPPR